MSRINTNVTSLLAQQTLGRANDSLQTSLTRLSTGLRINSGKDDPAGLIASEALRSDIISTEKAIRARTPRVSRQSRRSMNMDWQLNPDSEPVGFIATAG